MFRVFSPLRVSHNTGRGKGFASGLALAVALASGGVIASAAFAVPASAQSDAPQYSKNFGKAAQQASANLNAVRAKPEVDAEVNNLIAASKKLQAATDNAGIAAGKAEMQAIGTRIQGMVAGERRELETLAAQAQSPDEKYTAGEFLAFIGAFSYDQETRIKGLKLKLDSGTVKPETLAQSWIDLAQLYYDTNRRDEAHNAFDAAYKAGNLEAAIYAADAYFKSNRVAAGLDYLDGLIAARIAAGQDVPLTWYGTGLTQSRTLADGARIGHWAGLYAARGNTPEAWNASIATVLGSSSYGLAEQLDAYRLMKRTGALLTEASYVGYLNAAMGKAGVAYPGEVVTIAQAAQASGKITRDPGFVNNALTTARGLQTQDKASLPALASDARKGANGQDALASGDAYLSYEMAPQAEEMYALALSKGGVDNDLALTRLAIAQADQGKYAEARANFAKVSGTRAPIAAIWLAYVDSKAPRS